MSRARLGDCYTFSVSATLCPEEPEFGDEISDDWCTPRIIIDEVVEFQGDPCSLGTGIQTTLNQEIEVCVEKSSLGQGEPFSKTSFGRLQNSSGKIIDFIIAFNGTDVFIGEDQDDSDVNFNYAPNNEYFIAECYLNDKDLSYKVFSASNVNTTFTDRALLEITFYGSYTFQFCDFCPLPQSLDREMPWKETTSQSPAQISPNPFSQSTTFRYTLNDPGPVDISLYDAMGRLVKVVQKTTLQESGNYETTVDGAGLPDGVYFLHTMTGQNRQVFSLVKQE